MNEEQLSIIYDLIEEKNQILFKVQLIMHLKVLQRYKIWLDTCKW